MNIIGYSYIYNNIFNIINDGILLQFSSSSTSSYYCRRRSTMMRVHDAGVLCTIVFGIVDSTSRVSAALWAAIIRGYCNGYTHSKSEDLSSKNVGQILAMMILKILDRLSGVSPHF